MQNNQPGLFSPAAGLRVSRCWFAVWVTTPSIVLQAGPDNKPVYRCAFRVSGKGVELLSGVLLETSL